MKLVGAVARVNWQHAAGKSQLAACCRQESTGSMLPARGNWQHAAGKSQLAACCRQESTGSMLPGGNYLLSPNMLRNAHKIGWH